MDDLANESNIHNGDSQVKEKKARSDEAANHQGAGTKLSDDKDATESTRKDKSSKSKGGNFCSVSNRVKMFPVRGGKQMRVSKKKTNKIPTITKTLLSLQP